MTARRWVRLALARVRRMRRFPHELPWSDRQLERMGAAVQQQKVKSHRRKLTFRGGAS